MPDLRLELLDKANDIQRRIQLISTIYINQMILLEERFSDDCQDLQKQLVELKDTIRKLDSEY